MEARKSAYPATPLYVLICASNKEDAYDPSATDEVLRRIEQICHQRGLMSLVAVPPRDAPLITADITVFLEPWYTQLHAQIQEAMLLLIYGAMEPYQIEPVIEMADHVGVPTIILANDKGAEQFVQSWPSEVLLLSLAAPDSERRLAILVWYLASRRILYLIASEEQWPSAEVDNLLSKLDSWRVAAEASAREYPKRPFDPTGEVINQTAWKAHRKTLQKDLHKQELQRIQRLWEE